jgi:hypothetical protein
MKKITAEVFPMSQMQQEDIDNFIGWAWNARHINLLDPEVLAYPRAVMCKASAGDEPLLYIPIQPVLMFESIAPNPAITERQEALALWRIGEQVTKVMQDSGHAESYFVCSDDRVADLCAAHGYEEVKGVRLLKRKLTPEEREAWIPKP